MLLDRTMRRIFEFAGLRSDTTYLDVYVEDYVNVDHLTKCMLGNQ